MAALPSTMVHFGSEQFLFLKDRITAFFESYPTPMSVLALLTKKGHLVIAHPGTPDVSLQKKMSKGNQSVWRLVIWLVWRLTIGKPKERATSKRWLRNGLIQIRQPLVVPPSTTSPKGSENAVPVSGSVWIYQENTARKFASVTWWHCRFCRYIGA